MSPTSYQTAPPRVNQKVNIFYHKFSVLQHKTIFNPGKISVCIFYTQTKTDRTNIIFCSIAEAIKYSFNLIKKEFKSYPLNCTDIICLQYKNVYTPDTICEDVEAILEDQENNDGKYLVSFSNCKVNILGALSVKNETDTIMEYDQFLSEMFFDKINFYQNVRSTKGELNITFKYDETFINTFNYNKTDPIFDNNDTNLIEQMNNILKDILENYIYVWESKIEIDENTQLLQITYLNQIINRFSKEYSIIKVYGICSCRPFSVILRRNPHESTGTALSARIH